MQQLIRFRREIFVFFFGIALFTTGWMSALTRDIQHKGVTGFSIMQLELPGDEAHLYATVQQLTTHEAIPEVIRHLRVDYFFMLGIYPLIAVWLLILRINTRPLLSGILLIVALLQVLPWVFDVMENNRLLQVVQGGPLGMSMTLWETMVYAKFVIAVSAGVLALLVVVFKLLAAPLVNKNT
ncbi:hypothetical protein [Chitinophaga nivalis]|uniref:DUF4386 domain-containing protein n=1 Tax=Chitinophaga nivalis TaxID=2991709 RepID=A0ABT3IHC8_9BACT|nr:hypothetical protein [Chitinophaga nivalis]MCW3467104.1 hypothetical protein [Chitinophaga nivalis]MCW3483205.1 hypothetical protein [Chitinophaga nivalis]